MEYFTDVTNNIYTKQQVSLLLTFPFLSKISGIPNVGETFVVFIPLQVVKMEADILNFLKFEIGSPTARTFLRYVLCLKLWRSRVRVTIFQSPTQVVL